MLFLRSIRSPRPGFALVVALSLMAFLLLLGLALQALLSTEKTVSASQFVREQARQNALLGLHIALGELQEAMGRDQRVSAPAYFLPETHEDWEMLTGVWDSDPESETYGERRYWLISGGESLNLSEAPEAGTPMLLSARGGRAAIRAPAVSLHSNEQNSGSFAWWIADEGVKASVKLEPSSAPSGNVSRWRSAHRFAPEIMLGLEALNIPDEWLRPLTRDHVGFLASSHGINDAVVRDYFHDYTLRSDAVLSNTRDGGLKRDLTAGLQPGRSDMENELGRDSIFPPQWNGGANYDPGGPLWEQLRSFYNTRVSGNSGSGTIDFRRGDNRTQAIMPVLTHSQFYVHARPVDSDGDFFRFYIMPAFGIWNPYQHRLRMPEFWITVKGTHPMAYKVEPEGGSAPENPSLSTSQLSWRIPATVWEPGEIKLFCMHSHQPLPEDPASSPNNVTLSEGWVPGFGNYRDAGQISGGLLQPPYSGKFEVIAEDPNTLSVFFASTPVTDHGDNAIFAWTRELTANVNKQNNNRDRNKIESPHLAPEASDEPLMTLPGESFPSFGWRSVMKFGRMTKLNMTYTPGRDPSFNPAFPLETLYLGHYNPRAIDSGMLPEPARQPYWMNPLWASEFRQSFQAPQQYDETGNYAAGFAGSLPASTRAAYFEFLREGEDVVSLGRLAHAGLDRRGHRHPYNNHYPAFPIGNSLADPRVPANATYRAWSDIQVSSSTQYDYSYLLNDALWDSYFFSDVPRNGPLDPEELSKNPRLRLMQAYDEQELRGYQTAARNFMVEGAFNINSHSVEAWKALLASFIGEDVRTGDGLERGAGYSSYARYYEPISGVWDESEDEISEQTHGGFRRLNQDQIDELARAIVDALRARIQATGKPFLSMGAFVNRSLDSPNNSHRLKGVLQQAIDTTSINEGLRNSPDLRLEILSRNSAFRNIVELRNGRPTGLIAEQIEGDLLFGVPGYLTQADLLSALGHVLSPRSDTFLIRAYGDVINPISGEVQAKAWCEAEVQRIIEPLDAGDIDRAEAGRRFVITHFRWLEEAEL